MCDPLIMKLTISYMKAYKVLTEENTQKIINERARERGGVS